MLLLSSLFIITIIIQNLDISFNYIGMYMYEWIGFWCRAPVVSLVRAARRTRPVQWKAFAAPAACAGRSVCPGRLLACVRFGLRSS